MWGLLTVSGRAVKSSAPADSGFDPKLPWCLHPQVALREEPFGALLYHFGTRKLSFLKNRTIVAVVQTLSGHPDVVSAVRAVGVNASEQEPYLQALQVLANSSMIIRKELL